MNKTKITPGNYQILFQPIVELRLENGPIIRSEFQVIAYKDILDKEWKVDIEMLDVEEVTFMGVTITDYKEVKKFLDHFKDMGIDLCDATHDEFQEMFDMSGSVEQFIFEQTGIQVK